MKWTVIMRSWVEDFAKKIEEKQDGDPFIWTAQQKTLVFSLS
jgi:hypothetical protein